MKLSFSKLLALFAALLFTVSMAGCEVEVDKDGPVEDVVEDLDD